MGRLCYPTQHPGRVLVPRLRRGREIVTVQGGYGVLFAVMVQILLSITRVAVQFVSEPEICHGCRSLITSSARVRVQRPLRICLRCRSKSKNRDKQLTHIVRVIRRLLLNSRCLPNTVSNLIFKINNVR
jgi:hypothetical protein